VNSKLNQLYEKLESQRLQLLEKVKLAPERFNVQPEDNRWSLHQVLAHLVTAEKLSVMYLDKKIQGIDEAGNTGIIEDMKMMVLKVSQRLPLKFTAPKKVVASTPSYISLNELIDDWNTTRQKLKTLLETVQDHQLKRKIFKHFVIGKLNIVHALEFLGEHIAHHLPQINRLLK